MKKDTDGLTLKQRAALPFFISNSNVTSACKEAGIAASTYYEWIREDAFKAALDQGQTILREEAFSILKANLPKAAQTLVDLLQAPTEAVRRLAAKDILDLVHVHIDVKQVEERIKTLEERKR